MVTMVRSFRTLVQRPELTVHVGSMMSTFCEYPQFVVLSVVKMGFNP